ncbi:MAG: HpaII family restriction endonuclease, partial [Phascolarctobacterium sp.]|nr:HpaII family restriction endonuclease [Candidatus Phascolarctobacterium caballi]
LYGADANLNKAENVCFTILKIMRDEKINSSKVSTDYVLEKEIAIFRNNKLLAHIPKTTVKDIPQILFEKIVNGKGAGSFSIPEAEEFMNKLHVTTIKAASNRKADIRLRVHDYQVNFDHEVGFSIKSDVGSAPTLFNAGINTKIQYILSNMTDGLAKRINGINKSNDKNYMTSRMKALVDNRIKLKFENIVDGCFEGNLMMVDSYMPEIYANLVATHYLYGKNYCTDLIDVIEKNNFLKYRRDGLYRYKFKHLLSAMALGMTAGKTWDGMDEANGGYIVVKKDGDLVCYHLYNRNYFEQYLLANTKLDNPSASRYDYGYLFKENGEWHIQLNAQVRFK